MLLPNTTNLNLVNITRVFHQTPIYNWKCFEKYRALSKWVIINLISLYHPFMDLSSINLLHKWDNKLGVGCTSKGNIFLKWEPSMNSPLIEVISISLEYKSLVEKSFISHCVCTSLYKFTIFYVFLVEKRSKLWEKKICLTVVRMGACNLNLKWKTQFSFLALLLSSCWVLASHKFLC